MEEEKIFEVSGQLSKDFVGHIAYTVVLPPDLDELYILFLFNKYPQTRDMWELIEGCRKSVKQNLPEGVEIPECMMPVIYKMPKTEINLSIFLGDVCIGSAHRDLPVKEIKISPDGSSDGFLNCHPMGVLRVVLHVFNVLSDETSYILYLKGGKKSCL